MLSLKESFSMTLKYKVSVAINWSSLLNNTSKLKASFFIPSGTSTLIFVFVISFPTAFPIHFFSANHLAISAGLFILALALVISTVYSPVSCGFIPQII